jgi:Arc/MetJ-type ribon-helix-helix transcriptional regulator
MMVGMTRKDKIAVTLPHELVVAARTAVRDGRAASVSAYVAAAMEQRAKEDDLDAILEEILAATGGPMTEAERDEIDRKLGWRQP